MPEHSRQSPGSSRDPVAAPDIPDNQQVQDDNQTSGTSNQAADRDPAEGPRDDFEDRQREKRHAQ